MSNETQQQPKEQDKAQTQSNLDEIEQELETSSQHFKPKPGKAYVIKMDPQNDKITPVENDRFKDSTQDLLFPCDKYIESFRRQGCELRIQLLVLPTEYRLGPIVSAQDLLLQ